MYQNFERYPIEYLWGDNQGIIFRFTMVQFLAYKNKRSRDILITAQQVRYSRPFFTNELVLLCFTSGDLPMFHNQFKIT